jgi:hypothetical protein
MNAEELRAVLPHFTVHKRHNRRKNYCDAGECKLEQLISELVGKWKKKSSISAEPDASLRFMLMREKREKEKEKRSDVPLANVTNYYTETKTRCLLMT